ncbi:MAG: hypothetical protein E7089_07755 [Bacteroidales bacterium]|nr:hypothetical protein [Bacteroidales bacterium]
MKQLRIFSALFMCLFALSFAACSKDDSGSDYITVTPEELYFESDVASDTLDVESSGEWSVANVPTWIQVMPLLGNNGDKLVVTVSKNSTIDERTAVLSITCGDANVTVNVIQYGNIDTDYVELGFDTPGVSYIYSESTGNLSVTYSGVSVPAVKTGSAIVLPAQYDYDIRVVENCTSKGNSIEMTTREGNMCNLFKNVKFTLSTNPNATRNVVGERVFSPFSCGYHDEQGVYHELYKKDTRADYTVNYDLWRFTSDFSGANICQGAGGSLRWDKCIFDAGLQGAFSFDFGIGNLKEFSYNITGNVDLDMLLRYSYSASYSDSGDEIIQKNVIKPIVLKFRVGVVVIPVIIETDLCKSHSFEANGKLDVTTGVKSSNKLSVGLAWRQGSGFTVNEPVSSSEFSVYSPTLEAEASMVSKVSYYPRVEVKLFKFSGPWLEPRPYLEDELNVGMRVSSDGKKYAGWRADLNGGIDMRFGIDLGFGKWEREVWSSEVKNLVEKDFFEAPKRITKISPDNGKELNKGESVTAEFLVESYCSLTNKYYPCPLALVSFDAQCGKLSDEQLVTDSVGKVKIKWTPDPDEKEEFSVATRSQNFMECTLTASIIDNVGAVINSAELIAKIEKGLCPDDNHPHMIDLGLPSGLKWACCNVGANSPEEYGDYFAWGETEPKSTYTEENCKTVPKYNGNIYIPAAAFEDAATANWGGSWRMPTETEMKELRNNCEVWWIEDDGIVGVALTSRLNGNGIFIPAAGYHSYSSHHCGDEGCCFWSSTPYDEDSYYAYSLYLGIVGGGTDARYCGLSVRPVSK